MHVVTWFRSWALWLGLGIFGVVAQAVVPTFALACYTAAGAVLLVRAFLRARFKWSSPRAWLAMLGGAGLLAGLFLYALGPWVGDRRMVLLAAGGAQVLLLALALRSPTAYGGGRGVVVVLGHVAALVGHESVWRLGPTRIAVLAYAGSLVVLTLHAYWTHRAVRDDETLRSWESPFLIIYGLGGVGLALTPSGWFGDPLLAATGGMQLAILGSLALLAGPRPLPAAWRARPGGVVEFLSQAIVVVLLLNILLILVILRFPVLRLPLVLLAMTWLVVAVISEYGAVIFGRRRQVRAPDVPHAPLTVVVSAMDEASHIGTTLAAALSLPSVERLVVVVAARSQDETAAIAEAAAQNDSRVFVVHGTGRTKAEDLTEAWRHVETDIALVLDADEQVEPSTLAHGLHVLAEHPGVGIVQGRKVARPQGALGHFIVVERRYSTLADHPAQDRVFGAAHFGGSAALIRRQVPADAGWWRSIALTEDIEFTMRVHMDTPWHIQYEPRLVVWEEAPADVAALVRQRSRWARGWSQVSRLYLPRLGRANMPLRGKVGLGWQLITAISAPWSVFFPTLLTLWLWGEPIQLPVVLALVLGFVILPSRVVTYGVPYFRDPLVPVRHRIRHFLGAVASAYLWVVVGWFMQLHALYLELSSAPKTWHATRARR